MTEHRESHPSPQIHLSSPSPRKEVGSRGEVHAVVFDIDGVLLDSHAANAAYYRDVLARYGYPPVPDAELAYGHSHTLRDTIAYLTGADAAAAAIFEAVRDLAGYPYDLVREPPGCTAALESLAGHYALGVMSSRIVEGIRQYINLSGTHDLFTTFVGYDDTERHKPHPDPLLLACERLGVSPEATVYVGDAPTDMACAHSAGAHFIAFGDAIPDAEHVITHFKDLSNAIHNLTPLLPRRESGLGGEVS